MDFKTIRKSIIFSRNSSMGFATEWETKKLCAKEWSKKHLFHSHFFIFHHKPKLMLEFLQNGYWNVIVQKMREKRLSHLDKMHFSVSGHVTLGVVRWRHELNHISFLWVLSKFGPIEAHKCRVIAKWFFPSNGIKRYFNGPLTDHIYNIIDWQTLYSLFRSGCWNVSHQQQFFSELLSPGRSQHTNYWSTHCPNKNWGWKVKKFSIFLSTGHRILPSCDYKARQTMVAIKINSNFLFKEPHQLITFFY